MKRILNGLRTLLLVTIIGGAIFIAADLALAKMKRVEIREIPVERIVYQTPDEPELHELIEQVSGAYGVPPVLTLAMIRQESGRGLRTDRVRFEPHILSRHSKKIPKHLNGIEAKMWASSHGLLQVVYVLHHERCGLKSFTELYEPRVGLECGLAVLTDCMKRWNKETNKVRRLRKALQCYNGGSKYPGEVLEHLAEIVIEQL